ncbi:DUF2064 domain-containing protein [Ferruginibacter yonginensis]|uniref:DUF2064 domain-containing protein n=1 Tax=Ferruginibacter yonginensis TaxID=1310416 RepID=A0ABV8QTB2_9BACT
MQLQQTAILVFAQTAQAEQGNKSFALHKHGAAYFQYLNRIVFQKVQKTGLPFFIFSEKEQVGKTFGEKISNAVNAVFEKGFQNIMIVGNDSPQLQTKHLLKAHQQILLGNTVIGKNCRGGAYLIAFNKKWYQHQPFKNVSWQSNQLYHDLCGLFTNTINIGLPTLIDINAKADAVAVFSTLAYTCQLKKLLVNLLQYTQLFATNLFFQLYLQPIVSHKGLRAPPSAVFIVA